MSSTDATATAQGRVDRIAAFRGELAALDEAGILRLTPDQRAALDRYHAAVVSGLVDQYDVDVTDASRRLSLAMRIAALVGAAALAAAVVLFTFRIWGLLGPVAQALVLTAGPLLGLVLAVLASRLDSSRYFASIAAVVALAAFVADLQSMQDAFGLTPSPHVYAAWAIYGAILAYALRVRVVFVGALLCLAAWVSAWLTTLSGGPIGEALDVPEYLLAGGSVVFALCALPAHRALRLDGLCRGFGGAIVLLVLLVLGISGGSELALPRAQQLVAYQVIGPAAAIALIAAGIRWSWREAPYVGTVGLAVMVLQRFADWWWDRLPHYLFFVIVGAVAVATLVALRRLHLGQRRMR